MAVMERLAVPRRLIALLQGESLLNDATALTVYHVALGAAVAATPLLGLAPLGRFVAVGAGGIAIGWRSGGSSRTSARGSPTCPSRSRCRS